MAKRRINPSLLEKMANRSGKSQKYLREQISRKAGKQGISSAAAQIVWAKELGIGTANALNKLPADVREEVRSVHSATGAAVRSQHTASGRNRSRTRKEEGIT